MAFEGLTEKISATFKTLLGESWREATERG